MTRRRAGDRQTAGGRLSLRRVTQAGVFSAPDVEDRFLDVIVAFMILIGGALFATEHVAL